jgi:hypothetical protein
MPRTPLAWSSLGRYRRSIRLPSTCVSLSFHGLISAKRKPPSSCTGSWDLRGSAKKLVFLSNDFTLPALTVADLYRSRWKIELFFNWIQTAPQDQSLYGTSENAVKTQSWIAVCVYVVFAILAKRLRLERDLYTICTDSQRHAVRKNRDFTSTFRGRITTPQVTLIVTSCYSSICDRTLRG